MRTSLAKTPIIIGEEDLRNVGGVSIGVVKCNTAKYISDQDNMFRWTPKHYKPMCSNIYI